VTDIVSKLEDDEPTTANVIGRIVEPDGQRLLQLDIYEPTGPAKSGRRSYRVHLTKDAVLEMARMMESGS